MTPRNGLKSWLNMGREVDTGRREAGSALVLWHTVEYWLCGGMEGNGLPAAKMCSSESSRFYSEVHGGVRKVPSICESGMKAQGNSEAVEVRMPG